VQRLVNIVGVVLVVGLLSAGIAAAASLGLSSGRLSAGSVVVAGCTSSSLTATRNVDNSGNVTQVNVLNVPQACSGETLAVTLENNLNASLGSATTAVGACTGGCNVAVTGFGTVSAATVDAFAISLTE
jgi:hypothetical protein